MYTKNKIKIKEYHLKYLYSKYKQICFPNTLDDIFSYCNIIDDFGCFWRNICKKTILNTKKELLIHSHIIFYIDGTINKLVASENILIDGTFIYPPSFYQTIVIIIYYDIIYYKMIPAIYIAIN